MQLSLRKMACAGLCLAAMATMGYAQYPDTLWVPVTFYDFHSNKSNPEFEQDHQGAVRLGMVQNALDANKKPVVGANPYMNNYIKYWFRSWPDSISNDTIHEQGDYTRPSYNYGNNLSYNGPVVVDYDTSFKDVVIQDSLPFLHQGGGIYQYRNDNFFLLDTRGFGMEGLWHNFSFTMELHWKFTKQPGMRFDFTGDDDVWAFINGNLAMDLGGIHSQSSKSFNVDDIPGLINGRDYDFDLFYAERHTSESHILITSNIISVPPSKLNIRVAPDSTIQAGQTVNGFAEIWADTGIIQNFSGQITWGFIDLHANNADSTFKRVSNTQIAFTPTEAYDTVLVWGWYHDAVQGVSITDTARIAVIPGPASHVVIEDNPAMPNLTDPNRLRNDSPKPFVRISGTQTNTEQVYGILRDKYGNWVGPANPATWSSIDNQVATATNGTSPALGQGRITRVANNQDTTLVSIRSNQGFTDDIIVYVDPVSYTQLRLVIIHNNVAIPVDSIVVRTDGDTALFIQGLRSDNSQWELIDGSWSSAGISLSPTAPTGTANFWRFQPLATGRGTITATASGSSGQISDQVTIIISHGPPDHMLLYGRLGNPKTLGLTAFGDTITIVAGHDTTIVAKLFDNLDEWLNEYESVDSMKNRISWRLTGVNATISTTIGPATVFHSTVAYATYGVTATMGTFTKSVAIKVIADAASRLYIEELSAYNLNSPQTFANNTMNISSRETYKSGFAILRDRYDNFVSYSNPTTWVTKHPAISTVDIGIAFQGEGIVRRAADIGFDTVIATNTATGFKDTVFVNLQNISYDSLRIVVSINGNFVNIDSLKMRTDQDTTIMVLGLRSDNGQWEQISAQWTAPGLMINPNPPASASEWAFSPTEPGTGTITVSLGDKRDVVYVTFLPGLPSKVALYTKAGAPLGSDKYPDGQALDDQRAGDTIQLYAKVFDHYDVWLSEYETNMLNDGLFSWTIVEGAGVTDSTGVLVGTGHHTRYVPHVAFRTVSIVVHFTPPGAAIPVNDTLIINTTAGAPDHIVIERSSNAKDVSPNHDAPLDTLVITPVDTVAFAYAIIRDRYGNYVSKSTSTSWQSLITSIVSAATADATQGQGKMRRGSSSGVAIVTATDLINTSMPHKTDSMYVNVVNYYYTQLRIVNKNGVPIDSLYMTTNDDTTLYVQGRKSTPDSSWEAVSASWAVSTGIITDPAAPTGPNWSFSPSVPAQGFIYVSLNNGITKPDTIGVNFAVGPPTQTTLTLVTPPNQIIAGAPIDFKVEIFNKDGKVPGNWCGMADFSDLLVDTTHGIPQIIYTRSDGTRDTVRLTDAIDLCFTDGNANVQITLYYAPETKSPHTIHLDLGPTLQATSVPFVLLPGPLSYIRLERQNGALFPDTLYMLYPDSSIVVFSRGYDAYGNKRGDEPSNWDAQGTLHDIARPNNVFRIFYDASQVTNNEEGFLRAIALDSSVTKIFDQSYIYITGPRATLSETVTRDLDGDGYLDAVVIKFNKPVVLDQNSPASWNAIDLAFGTHTWTYDSLVSLNGSNTDTVFTLYLKEDATGELQTGWTPYVSVSGLPGVYDIPPATIMAKDGAGPVIASVVKYVTDPADHTKDRVVIKFSEKIWSPTGNSIPLEIPPDMMFNVYIKKPDGTYELLSTILDSIPSFTARGDSSVEFTMVNNQDLTRSMLINISSDTLLVVDNPAKNAPNINNRKVQVEVLEVFKPEAFSFPNPSIPTFKEVGPGTLRLEHEPMARRWVLKDGAGSVISFRIKVPPQTGPGSETKIKAFIKVYDRAGNMVINAKQDDLVGTIRNVSTGDISTFDVDVYWNGANAQGMPCAPGVYRVIVYVDYQPGNATYEDARMITTVGIGR